MVLFCGFKHTQPEEPSPPCTVGLPVCHLGAGFTRIKSFTAREEFYIFASSNRKRFLKFLHASCSKQRGRPRPTRHMADSQGSQGIQVLVRVRPPNERERQANRFCVEVDAAKKAVLLCRWGQRASSVLDLFVCVAI